MKLATAFALLLLSIAFMTAFLLGLPVLDQDVAFGLNAGVLAAAVSLIFAAVGPNLLTPFGTRIKTVALATIAFAIAWLPVSVALAGGTQLSYSGWQSIAWLIFTGTVLLAITSAWISALLFRLRSKTAA